MVAELLQNPHYIIDFNSYEGLRNIAITTLLFILILILGRNLNKSKNLLIIKIISLMVFKSFIYFITS